MDILLFLCLEECEKVEGDLALEAKAVCEQDEVHCRGWKAGKPGS